MVGAEIDLDDCIDLLDIPWERTIVTMFEHYLEHLAQIGQALPKQTRGAHRLDREVMNYLIDGMTRSGGRVRSVRAAFAEGEPTYPGSALMSRAHVQIAVRARPPDPEAAHAAPYLRGSISRWNPLLRPFYP
ncbi:MAG TPA: hypothetical protein VFR37_25435 [Longimicrobium sp.]|nr:hypothetical protein [Longimicrobium sp.]